MTLACNIEFIFLKNSLPEVFAEAVFLLTRFFDKFLSEDLAEHEEIGNGQQYIGRCIFHHIESKYCLVHIPVIGGSAPDRLNDPGAGGLGGTEDIQHVHGLRMVDGVHEDDALCS